MPSAIGDGLRKTTWPLLMVKPRNSIGLFQTYMCSLSLATIQLTCIPN